MHSGESVSSVRFSKNSKYILSSGRDSKVMLWELSTGEWGREGGREGEGGRERGGREGGRGEGGRERGGREGEGGREGRGRERGGRDSKMLWNYPQVSGGREGGKGEGEGGGKMGRREGGRGGGTEERGALWSCVVGGREKGEADKQLSHYFCILM